MKSSSKREDCGYGWVVVAAAFAINFLVDGLQFSSGVLLVEFLDHFKQSHGMTAFIGALQSAMMHLIGPLAAILTVRLGVRVVTVAGAVVSCVGLAASFFATTVTHLTLTMGAIGGAGLGLMSLPPGALVVQYFTERRALANGIAVCGSGVGTFVFNNVMFVLISEFTWRGAVLVAAGAALNGAVFGLLLRPLPGGTPTRTAVNTDGKIVKISSPGEIPFSAVVRTDGRTAIVNEVGENFETVKLSAEKETVVEALTTRHLLKDSRLLLFMAFSFMISLGFFIPFSFIPDEAVNTGMSKYQAIWLMSSIGISNTVSRILIGWIGDRNCVNRPVMLVAVVANAGLSIAAVPFLPSFAAKLFIVAAVGFFLGGFMMLFAVVLADMFGDEVLTRSIGLSYFTIGLACFVAGPKGGSECLLAAALLAAAISLHRKSYVMESVRDPSGKSGGLESQGKDKQAK
ncbi:monocarboxylate transporter 12-like isoform X2 [Mya arenaria]|uniref:monocarboxylate transporter 12-like isoform X2 n=1 Tax=Mya arenaria TaxID=6604 RepID=UPI0022E19781|nr:monocarboxylate transporter 12-like isoform X2 [Mya arenaria]